MPSSALAEKLPPAVNDIYALYSWAAAEASQHKGFQITPLTEYGLTSPDFKIIQTQTGRRMHVAYTGSCCTVTPSGGGAQYVGFSDALSKIGAFLSLT